MEFLKAVQIIQNVDKNKFQKKINDLLLDIIKHIKEAWKYFKENSIGWAKTWLVLSSSFIKFYDQFKQFSD